MIGMYKVMEDCVGQRIDETMDAEQVIILYKRWTIVSGSYFQV